MKSTFIILAVVSLVAADNWSSAAPASSNSSAATNATSPSGNYSNTAYNTSNSTGTGSSSGSAAAPAYTAPAVAIPSSASQGCQTFLQDLNTSPTIQSCIAPALNAVNVKSPSLATFCSAASSQGCSAITMRTWLTYFAANCSSELLTSPVKAVQDIYDSMYVALPLSGAVCAKDTSGNFCLSNSANNTASGISNAAQQPLSATDGTPNADVFNTANILFIGANPNMTAAQLCTECTKSIMTSYFSFESTTAYAGGLASSALLGHQSDLYSAISTTCGASFLAGALNNADSAQGLNYFLTPVSFILSNCNVIYIAGSTPSALGGANGAITFSPAKELVVIVAVMGGFMAL